MMETPEGNVFSLNCPSRRVLDRIADRWTVLVLLRLRDGAARFNALQRQIGGISQKMLSRTLVMLERDGLVTRTAYPTKPVMVEYKLTSMAFSLIEHLDGLRNWSEVNFEGIEAANSYDARKASGR